jgi:hypothetical protein
MGWRRLGHVYAPDGELPWARTHAFLPTAVVRGDRILVLFTSLDDRMYGRVGAVELDAEQPTRVVATAAEPLLGLGELGAFDDCGVNASSLVESDEGELLYYIGWQRAERVPHLLFTGLATRPRGGGAFARHARVPVLDRTDAEPFSRSAPCVLRDGGRWRVWYWSCERWVAEADGVRYRTVIKHAESADGVSWTGNGTTCLEPPEDDDYAVGRPWVVRDADRYRMWYSTRSRGETSYRIGYAESLDGTEWTRDDGAGGLLPAADGWDSEMTCFPCVVDAGGRRLLFYNGNRHGATGFGVAQLDG